jgi:hypothetical protein
LEESVFLAGIPGGSRMGGKRCRPRPHIRRFNL